MIVDFIKRLEDMKKNDPKTISRINNFPLLIEGLRELDKMIGMKTFKADIISSIKNYLISDFNDTNRNHSVISGSPGCGKTSLAKIIAKIDVALGLINRTTRSSFTSTISETNYEVNPFVSGLLFILITAFIFTPKWYIGVIVLLLIAYILIFCRSKKYTNVENLSTLAKDDDYFVTLKREDLVSQYIGGTAPLARAALNKCVGKVVFIDEAYKLVSRRADIDPYGNEALNVLIEWMDQYRGRCLVIFGGYETEMNATIFRSQPGLKRRCQKVYHIDPYTSDEIFEIFKLQLRNKNLSLISYASEISDIRNLFHRHMELFPYSGGDTERLVDYIEQIQNAIIFDSKALGVDVPDYVSKETIVQGMNCLRQAQRDVVNPKKSTLEELLESI